MTEPLEIRLGALVLSANAAFLLFGAAFFGLLAYRSLVPARVPRRLHAFALLGGVGAGALLGGWLCARLVPGAPPGEGLPAGLLHLQFGSMGAFWGVLLAGAALARSVRLPVLDTLDQLVPPLLIGGAVARVGDCFTGASPGVAWEMPLLHIAPFHPWPLYDIATLLVLAFAAHRLLSRAHAPGAALVAFLLGYGFLRFAIEPLRSMPALYLGLTPGQVMAALQFAAGAVLAAYPRIRRGGAGSRAPSERATPPCRGCWDAGPR